MAARPEIKDQILARLRAGGRQTVADPYELRRKLGMEDVSATQFAGALESLIYNSGQVGFQREEFGSITAMSRPRTYWAKRP